MTRWSSLFAAALLVGLAVPIATATTAAEGARVSAATREDLLQLDAVLASVNARFPLLLAAELERDARQAEVGIAAGDFDTRLYTDGDLRPAGFYESYRGSAGLEQQTKLWGTRIHTAYRYGGGDFPSYEGGKLTDEAGEVRAGFSVPLLRGGVIDASRARLRQSEIAAERVGPEIELKRIATLRDASFAYWAWVSAGLRHEVEKRLLEFSTTRQAQIARRVERGAEPRIDLVDNQRLIVDRRFRLRAARRDVDQAAIDLSMFLRDEDGRPRFIHTDRIPSEFPTEVLPEPERFEIDLEYARAHHPILRQLLQDRKKLEVDAKLARNDTLPALDLGVQASQDFGRSTPGIDTSGKLSGDPRSETEVMALIRIEFPVQRRTAKGRLALARTRLAQLEQRALFEADRIVAHIQRAIVGLEAAFDQTREARTNFDLAERLRVAEERKLALGSTNLIDVNIREVQAAAAARGLIDAQADYFRALADYESAVARSEPFASLVDESAAASIRSSSAARERS